MRVSGKHQQGVGGIPESCPDTWNGTFESSPWGRTPVTAPAAGGDFRSTSSLDWWSGFASCLVLEGKWLWLKMKELGPTAGFPLWFHLPRGHCGKHFFEPQPHEKPPPPGSRPGGIPISRPKVGLKNRSAGRPSFRHPPAFPPET